MVLSDIFLFFILSDYRNILGKFDDYKIIEYVYRLLPNFLMLLFYSIFIFMFFCKKVVPYKLLYAHSMFYIFLSIALFIPWGGIFIAPLTPVSILYLGSIIWVAEGFYVSLFIALIFFILNVYLLKISKFKG